MTKQIILNEDDIKTLIGKEFNVDPSKIDLEAKKTVVGYYETEKIIITATFTEPGKEN